jgi:hypothetical protein
MPIAESSDEKDPVSQVRLQLSATSSEVTFLEQPPVRLDQGRISGIWRVVAGGSSFGVALVADGLVPLERLFCVGILCPVRVFPNADEIRASS